MHFFPILEHCVLIYTLSRVLHGVLHNEIASLETSTKELDRGINARFTSKSKFKEFNEAIEVLRELLKDFIAGKDPLLFSRKADLLQSLFFFPLFSSYLAKYSKYLHSDVKSSFRPCFPIESKLYLVLYQRIVRLPTFL